MPLKEKPGYLTALLDTGVMQMQVYMPTTYTKQNKTILSLFIIFFSRRQKQADVTNGSKDRGLPKNNTTKKLK